MIIWNIVLYSERNTGCTFLILKTFGNSEKKRNIKSVHKVANGKYLLFKFLVVLMYASISDGGLKCKHGTNEVCQLQLQYDVSSKQWMFLKCKKKEKRSHPNDFFQVQTSCTMRHRSAEGSFCPSVENTKFTDLGSLRWERLKSPLLWGILLLVAIFLFLSGSQF